MTKIEVFNFMKKIKAYYQNFSIEDYVVNEWADRLKPYDINDVYRKFDEHLKGEYRNEIPKLHFITKYLKSSNEKKVNANYEIKCSVCEQCISLDNYEMHISRHNSIEYILKRQKYIGKVFDEKQLFNLSEERFQQLYDLFIEALYDKINDESEKHRLKNIVFSKEGLPLELYSNNMDDFVKSI